MVRYERADESSVKRQRGREGVELTPTGPTLVSSVEHSHPLFVPVFWWSQCLCVDATVAPLLVMVVGE